MTKQFSKIVFFIFILSNTACTHLKNNNQTYGITPKYLADIPVQTAIVDCMVWPDQIKLNYQTKVSLSTEEVAVFCDQYHNFITKAFTNQPFMRGLSPKLLNSLAEKDPQLKIHSALWTQNLKASSKHPQTISLSPINAYNKYVSPQTTWLKWLHYLKTNTKGSDAVLIPVIIEATSEKKPDRGLQVWQKKIRILSLLINTANAELIWSGHSVAESINSMLQSEGGELNEPDWKIVHDQLFDANHWKEYPGKQ